MKDILRAAVAVPALRVAAPAHNAVEIEKKIREAANEGVTLLTFPELSLTGYTCGDLFLSDLLLDRTAEALCSLAVAVPETMLVSVGAPLLIHGQLFNCAVLLSGGKIVGAVPKTFVPQYGTLDERRHFSGADTLGDTVLLTIGCFTFPVGTGLLFRAADGTTVGVEICEDLFSPIPPSSWLTLAGAEVILCPAACAEVVTGRAKRRDAVLSQSARTTCAYLFASASKDESTADLIFSGQGLIAQNGHCEAENSKLIDGNYLLIADLDLGKIRHDRRHGRTFGEAATRYGVLGNMETIDLPLSLTTSNGEKLKVGRLPFVPDDAKTRASHANEIFEMQASALARRLSVIGGKLTVGISGGLDSTLALLVAVRAMDKLELPHTNITAVTMPCFGTSDDTLKNALELMERLGVTALTVPIRDAVLQHFKDIGHAADDFSVTYENAQARERTQVLMDLANKHGGIVLGTGDLSEMALGWCTYNGDHMSMYGVNCGVPKTLIRWIIETVIDEKLLPNAADVLHRIIDTPISPELLPPDAVGRIAQKTEDIVGPYALHDFFLYYTVRYAYRPAKIYALAKLAFADAFDGATIKKWLAVFAKRFFTQQFKRNCVPDGIKIGSVALSPRGDWRMPSDASSTEWLLEIDEIDEN
ncbi:MAG: NAD(+) synthase [Ruminococcaceae bacterium]|nr:NAD(+) synthase [Oscillospiraceae bacterium]